MVEVFLNQGDAENLNQRFIYDRHAYNELFCKSKLKGDDMDWGKLLNSDKVTVTEFAAIILYLVHNNIAFEVTFAPRNQFEFATLQLTVFLNPRLNTSIQITLTDR
jgi:hypothetical protein